MLSRTQCMLLILAVCSTLAPHRAVAEPASRDTALSVAVLDAETELPVPEAEVAIVRTGQVLATGLTDESGQVAFPQLPSAAARAQEPSRADALYLEVTHWSYEFARIPLFDKPPSSAVRVLLSPAEVIEVTAHAYTRVARPATTLRGQRLQESLGTSVPETISEVPGVAVAFNGPGAARPTIRGLGGDRVLMLEDGFRTGDLYWSASDHGVMVEPLTARSVEIVRGPATLVYGGNALGGVVNVKRDDIPKLPPSPLVVLGNQVESASYSAAQGGAVVVPAGPTALRLEGSWRRGAEVRTPLGDIPNTEMTTFGGSAGLGYHPSWGTLGASARYYQNEYGVPGEFGGELIPGGHPGGADIEARRINGRFEATYLPSAARRVESVALTSSFTRYLHDEIEGVINGQRALGAAFALDTVQSNLVVRHQSVGSGPASLRGAVGASVLSQDLVAGGNAPGVRSGLDRGVAGFWFEELHLGALSLHAGLRYEYRDLAPDATDPIRVQTDAGREIEKSVTSRSFNLVSGSLAAFWALAEDWTLGLTLARSSRAPNLQELYSDGPHLADFSFDIGTPSLPTEVGTGLDLFLLAAHERFDLEATGFANFVDDYVLYAPTTETVRVYREGVRPRDTPVYEARNVDALFLGAEGKLTLRLGYGLSVEGTLSYVWAERRDDSDPLPFVPPLHGRAALRYTRSGFFASIGASGAAEQVRVPRAVLIDGVGELPQEPTFGYALAHASAGYHREARGMRHSLTARAFNLMDSVWRDHLSRIKDVAPQTGLNVSLTYQFQTQ